MGEALPPDIQELVNRRIANAINKPIDLNQIQEQWETTNPDNETLPQTIQDIIGQRIANSSNSLRLINRVKRDYQEQQRKLRN